MKSNKDDTAEGKYWPKTFGEKEELIRERIFTRGIIQKSGNGEGRIAPSRGL